MKSTTFKSFNGTSGLNVAIADGVISSIPDYSNFLLMLLNEGKFNG
jgi:hypothetical protein